MTPLELLHTLRDLDIHLTLMPDGEYFQGSAPAGVLTAALLDAIRRHKPALLAIHELYNERASLLEYDAGMSRDDAEREAWKYVEERYGNVYG
jgi:hypothetical protein